MGGKMFYGQEVSIIKGKNGDNNNVRLSVQHNDNQMERNIKGPTLKTKIKRETL